MSDGQQRMLNAIDRHADSDGWADWTDVYNTWDIHLMAPQLVGQAAQKVFEALVTRGLIVTEGSKVRRTQERA